MQVDVCGIVFVPVFCRVVKICISKTSIINLRKQVNGTKIQAKQIKYRREFEILHGLINISDRTSTEYMNLILCLLDKYSSDRLLIKQFFFGFMIFLGTMKISFIDISNKTKSNFFTFQVNSALTGTMDKVCFFCIPILICFLERKGQVSFSVHMVSIVQYIRLSVLL